MSRPCATLLLALSLSACGGDDTPISIQVFPAVLAADARGEAAAWDSVTFAGSPRGPAGLYRVAPEPLFTEWNIVAARPVSQPDGSAAVAARLNAQAARRISQFSAAPANLKKPLAVKVNDRWADFMPLLSQVNDRLILYGFTRLEVDQLQHHIEHR
jgi:hypothetical protein